MRLGNNGSANGLSSIEFCGMAFLGNKESSIAKTNIDRVVIGEIGEDYRSFKWGNDREI